MLLSLNLTIHDNDFSVAFRYCADLEIEKKVDLNELYVENSPLLVNGDLHLQITFRPID